MKIISISSAKGGVSKTSVSINLAQAYANRTKKVLCIDFDHNNNCTDFFLRDTAVESIEERNLYHVLTNRKRIEDCIFHTYLAVDVLPATPILSRIEVELARDPGALLRFPTLVRSLDYDYVIIDTPPSISFALTAALYTCDVVISPVSWSRWTIQGFSLLKEECDRASQGSGNDIQLFALPSMVTDIECAKLQSVDIWKSTFSYISRNLSIKNSGTSGSPLKRGSISWKQFELLAEEFQ